MKAPAKSAGGWWLYVIECRRGVLYTGIAKDVAARFAAHAAGTGATFTRRNRPIRILARAPLATRSEALRAEYALKQLPRAQKLRWCAKGLAAFVRRWRKERPAAKPALAPQDESGIIVVPLEEGSR